MSQYPNQLDSDVDLPRVDDNVTEEGGDAINALRDATFAIEREIGIGASGTAGSIANRLGVSLDAAGNIKASALTGLGLITLPITNSEISATAGIKESKLALDHPTVNLFNQINSVNLGVNTSLNFITNHGSKLEPHLQGVTYRHIMNQIDVDSNTNNYFKNKYELLRDNSNLYNLFKDINADLIVHETADSTSTGTVAPVGYGHVAAGIHLNTSNFSFVPQTATDLQQFAQFIDNSNIFILGTRIQTLYQNGIPRASRSAAVNTTMGQLIVSLTSAIAYHLNSGSSPVDNIDTGDDVIEFTPSASLISSSVFDSQFALVQAGDILTINYGSLVTSFVIKEKKYVVSGLNKKYVVRINGKNLFATTMAQAQINKPLFNTDKYGVLALAQAQPTTPVGSSLATLIAGNPRGAETLGINFNPDLIDSKHYNLYLVLYPNGDPTSYLFQLAAIDITGNAGQTPGQYTLNSIVETINAAFRTPGFNYRFIAFAYQGNLGIMLADSFNNASFSIISGAVTAGGTYDQSLTNTLYPNNVVGLFDNKDGLGFGPNNANIATPPYTSSYASALASQIPTRIFIPLIRKTYYVNGVERERLNIEPHQTLDLDGDGYWPATLITKNIIGSRVQVTYQVNSDLSLSGLKIGKTIVVQSEAGSGTTVDFGRFFIENIEFNSCNCDGYSSFTTITVYDGIHGVGITPYVSSAVGTKIRLYFSGDSIGFNSENLSDQTANAVYKRHFEVYVNEDGYTFSHERGRINISGSNITVNGITLYSSTALSLINIDKISPKLRGYNFNSVRKINLQISSYNQTTGIYDGYLCNFDGVSATRSGPLTTGKKGQITRFYDETNVDYIDFIFNINDNVSTINTVNSIDIQLFSTLSLDEEVMFLGTCQVNDITKKITYLKDARQFGNISESQLSTSALDYIAAPTKLLHENGIIKGFDITLGPIGGTSDISNIVSVNGGTAIVNGKVINMNNESIAIPAVSEALYPSFATTISTITWFLCVNDKAELELIASTDFDPNGSFAASYNSGSLDHTRIFWAINQGASIPTAYPIRGTYFSDLVVNQKDVTPIAIITTTTVITDSIPNINTGAVVKDVRRFVNNGYVGLNTPLILGPNSSFRNFSTLNAWLDQLLTYKSAQSGSNNPGNEIGTKVIVKGNNTISSTVSLNYPSEVIFEGDGATFTITSDIGFSLGSNIKFKNLKIDYLYDPIVSVDGSYISGQLSNPNKAAIYCNVSNLGNKNLSFENCLFTSSKQFRFGFLGFNFAASGCFLENINIINNKFQTSFAADDKLSVITFAGPSVAPTSNNGPRLINCNIENNYCNKNQLILISSPKPVSTVVDAIVPINVRITKNICGAINFLVKEDVPFSTPNTTFNADKLEGLTIKQNTCRYIYSGLSSGVAISAFSTLANGIFSAFVNISENSCSWIKTGVRVPTNYVKQNPPLIIKDNKLTAFNLAYLNDYATSPPTVSIAMALTITKGS